MKPLSPLARTTSLLLCLLPLLISQGCSSNHSAKRSPCGGESSGKSSSGPGGGMGGPGGGMGGPGGGMGGPGGGMGGPGEGMGGPGGMRAGKGPCDQDDSLQQGGLAATAHSRYFQDLNEKTAEINAYADALKEKDLLPGYLTEFHPYLALTRADLAAMLYAFYHYPSLGAAYDDVPADSYYYQATLHGRGARVLKDTFSFNPQDSVSRQEAALWIYKSERLAGMQDDEDAESQLKEVQDAAAITTGYRKAVATMLRLGVMRTDYQGNFSPTERFSRGEFAPIFYRLVSRNDAPNAMEMGRGPGNGAQPPKPPETGDGEFRGPPPGAGFAPMPNPVVDHGSYANKLTSNATQQQYSSTADAENALRIEGPAQVTLKQITVDKPAGKAAAGDASNFYGANAALLAMDGAQVHLQDSHISSNAHGANGVFAYGQQTAVTVSHSVIRTHLDNAGGIMVTGGAKVTVQQSDIETDGNSSAPLRSDRGGGQLTVSQGRYVSHGIGSPAIYSTADIQVADAELSASRSEAVVIEGKNSVHLQNCQVSGNMQRDNVQNLQNIMLYQSMSGDAMPGQAEFVMEGGSLTAHNGDMFYVTNTHANISLRHVALTLANPVLLKVAGNDARNGWGQPGNNGGHAVFTAQEQQLQGTILVDNSSSLTITLADNSRFEGAINPEGNSASVAVTLAAGSSWVLTADSYISNFKGDLNQLVTQGHKLTVNGEQLK